MRNAGSLYRERRRVIARWGVKSMSKIAGFCAVVLLVACAAIPARADCPDGYCDDGTILPGSLAERHEREMAAKRERYDRCVDTCSRANQDACKDACFRKAGLQRGD
jgi:hypothetical protein